MPNQYSFVPRPVIIPVGPSIAYVPLTRGQYALIDSEDAEIAGRHTWHALRVNSGDFYAKRKVSANGPQKRDSPYLHVAIMQPAQGMFIDHIGGNTLDNRKSQLRLATHTQNMRNKRTCVKNTSGLKGATWIARDRKWMAKITVNRKSIYLGYYDTVEDAHAAYREASARLHGDFGRLA